MEVAYSGDVYLGQPTEQRKHAYHSSEFPITYPSQSSRHIIIQNLEAIMLYRLSSAEQWTMISGYSSYCRESEITNVNRWR